MINMLDVAENSIVKSKDEIRGRRKKTAIKPPEVSADPGEKKLSKLRKKMKGIGGALGGLIRR